MGGRRFIGGHVPHSVRLTITDKFVIELFEGDLTQHHADAIVNAANSSLLGGGGVDGAIHRAGGPSILEQCRKIVQASGPLLPGRAVSTTAGALPAKFVIHTVGPVWHGGSHGEEQTLASCYRESLEVADQLQLTSVAFPSISTGAYGYPIHLAAATALATVASVLPKARYLKEARFVLFGQAAFQTYARELERLAQSNPKDYRHESVPNSSSQNLARS